MTESTTRIDATSLTRFEVEPDGTRVHLHVRDREGAPAVLALPVSYLSQLLMTVPRMLDEAVRRRRRDDVGRVVFPLERHRLEVGERDAMGEQQFILTLQTDGGFSVSFAASAEALTSVASTLLGDLPSSSAPEHGRKLLS